MMFRYAPKLLRRVRWGRVRAEPDWVSKTNLTNYLYCPYAFHLVATGASEHVRSPASRRAIAAGVQFEQEVVAAAVPAPVGKDQWTLLAEGHNLLSVETCENRRLGIRGRPDGIYGAGGAMAPVEIKNRSYERPTDKIELAFYWLLLAPWRRGRHHPHGWLTLNDQQGPRRIELYPQDLKEVIKLLTQVRAARQEPPPDPPCGRCDVCRAEDERIRHERGDLRLIWGIGRTHAEGLMAAGFDNYRALLAPSTALTTILHFPGLQNVSVVEAGPPIRPDWLAHARAYVEDRPVWFGEDPFPVPDRYVALDLEYDAEAATLWCAGLQGTGEGIRQLLVPPGEQSEATLLDWLEESLAAHAGLPVVTWGGTCADLPLLRKVAERHGRPNPLDGCRHVDLFAWVRSSVRFPTPKLSQDAVASCLDLERAYGLIKDGLDAAAVYAKWCRQGAHTDDPLYHELCRYNADDVTGLAALVEKFRVMSQGG